MNPMQLWETTMDPAIRTLLQRQHRRRDEGGHDLHDLMGEEVAPRKRFIQCHYDQVRNLDI